MANTALRITRPENCLGSYAYVADFRSGLIIVPAQCEGIPTGAEPERRTDRVTRFGLSQPFPNPARNGIDVFVSIPSGEQHTVKVAIYDVQGRLVRTLLNRSLGGGTHTLDWDQRNAQGSPVSSGIYFLQMKAGERGLIDTKKIVVVR